MNSGGVPGKRESSFFLNRLTRFGPQYPQLLMRAEEGRDDRSEGYVTCPGVGGREKSATPGGTIMKFRCAISVALFLAALTASAVAQDLTIDDFTTGNYQSPGYKSGLTHESIQTGSMMGGSRDTNMSICGNKKNCAAANPYKQASSYGFLPANGGQLAAMVQTGGYFSVPRIDMGYGYQTPLNADFTGYQKIRVNFNGLTQPLNFNIQPHTGGPYAQGGCNIPAYAGTFSVELPLNLFIQTQGFSFADVTSMDVIFQSASAIGSVSFGITSIELSNTTKGGLVIDCHY